MVDIPFRRDFPTSYAVCETVSPLVRRVIARNPGPFTANGTATFIVGRGQVAVIDPGPALPAHVDALLDALRGDTVRAILVSHTHIDHSPATAALQQATGAPSYGHGPHGGDAGAGSEAGADHRFDPDHRLADGDAVTGPGWRLTAVHTPGHTSNHLCFALAEEGILFSGDHVMGWSTSVITPPDGDMAAYLASLHKLLGRDDRLYMPTHGPVIDDPAPHVRAFIAHRHERADEIRRRLAAGDERIEQIVAAVYRDLADNLRPAAGRSVLAHLIEMVGRGEVACDGPPRAEARFRLARPGWSPP